MPSTYTPIATAAGTGSAGDITFTSIPGTYTDLILVANIFSTVNANEVVRVNGDSGNNYSSTSLYGTGSSALSSRQQNTAYFLIQSEVYSSSTVSALSVLHFMNYSNTTTNKTVISRTSQANRAAEAHVNLWRSTTAITSITISGATFTTNSTFTLYGVKSA